MATDNRKRALFQALVDRVLTGDGAAPAGLRRAAFGTEGGAFGNKGAGPANRVAGPANRVAVPANEGAVPANEGALPANEGALPALIEKVATRATEVTDADFAAAKSAGYTDDQVFELVICAAVGQAARMYEAGLTALEESA